MVKTSTFYYEQGHTGCNCNLLNARLVN